jgi:hypothetical protein
VVNGVVACISAVLMADSLGWALKMTTFSEPTPEGARNEMQAPSPIWQMGLAGAYRRRFNVIYERLQTGFGSKVLEKLHTNKYISKRLCNHMCMVVPSFHEL